MRRGIEPEEIESTATTRAMLRDRRWKITALFTVLTVAIVASTASSSAADRSPALAATEPSASLSGLPAADRRWVEQTFASLDLEHKAAQLLFVKTEARPRPLDSPDTQRVLEEVRELGVGGLVLSRSELDTVVPYLNRLQSAAAIPLLVSADFERSVAFRVDEGSVQLPGTMAIGALASDGEEAAHFAGELTARESRALGVHWVLGPVADVNNNPANPVINTRSFGEEPERVAKLVAAFIAGAHSAKPSALTSVKHFPGHGDTAVDSHHGLPQIAGDRGRLDRVELVPFRAAIAAGADSVMLGHLQVPAIDPSLAPATLSRPVTTTLLRDELGFRGLAVTDAMDMSGVGGVWVGAAAVRAVAAGADVVLMPPDPHVAAQSIARAVREGQLPLERLDAAVLRVLAAKARLGLHRQRLVDAEAARSAVGRSQDQQRADAIARRAITLVRNTGDVVPLAVERPLRILHLVMTSEGAGDNPAAPFDAELDARRIARQTQYLASPSASERTALLAEAKAFTHVVVSSHLGRGAEVEASQAELLNALGKSGVPTVVISFGSPYLATQLPQVPALLTAWGPWSPNQRAAVQALFGESAIEGRLPVTIPGVANVGDGIVVPRRALGLTPASAAEAGFRPEGLDEVMRVLNDFQAQGAFPGGVIAVGHGGKLAMLRPFGRLSYDAGAPAVTADTLYDLASLTKVVATTTMAMILVDQKRLDLDAPVVSFLPGFVDAPGQGSGKQQVTVRQLLTHSAGLAATALLFKEVSGRQAYLQRIQTMPLVYAPGTQTRYSDLGVILLGEILERVAGVPLDQFVRAQVFDPIGMQQTRFFTRRPAPDLLAPELLRRVAPTENDPWRGRVVRGEVHDENAFALGGVAPHAGLFSTAGDLARFAQMLLNGGVFEHQRVVSRDTVELFTRRADPATGSSRALGWDTKSPDGSSAGALFSDRSFGHTGFTGTSLWIDPQRDLFVILLTNRVHPTRDNKLIQQVRPAVADAVIAALAQPPVRVGLERVVAGETDSLRGKRLGLVAHAASVTANGTHAVDALRGAGLDVVRLFSPEHGLTGSAAAGETVADTIDPRSGLPVVSLYGERSRPRAADLAGLDALVFDLQDVGVRFYTYGATLFDCIDAAAQARIPLVVLDRPNPLGGERVEGPVAASRSLVKASAVNRLPGPLIHGLTLGEMARWENARRAAAGERTARLEVVAMAGWKRDMSWADTGRPWPTPSPNLRSASAALAYPGTALLEATNVSEGRGSEAPFLIVGAPWLPAQSLPIAAPGFRLTPLRFTLQPSPATPTPKYPNIDSAGWRVDVTDTTHAQPYRLGITLLRELSRLPDFQWLRDGAGLTWLTGTPVTLERIRSAMSIDAIVTADAADHAAWREARRSVLLYPDQAMSP